MRKEILKQKVRQGLLNNTNNQEEVIQRKLSGETNCSISANTGLHRNTLTNFFARHDIKEKIEKERARIASLIPAAVKNVKDLIEIFPSLESDDVENKKLSYIATRDLLKGMNVYSNSQMNINIQNNNQRVVLPEVLHLLQRTTIDLEENVKGIDGAIK